MMIHVCSEGLGMTAMPLARQSWYMCCQLLLSLFSSLSGTASLI